MSYRCDIHAITHRGKVRELNEDCLLLDSLTVQDSMRSVFTSRKTLNVLTKFFVADGMGGHAAGDYASQYICNAITEGFQNQYSNSSTITDTQLMKSAKLETTLGTANQSLYRVMSESPERSGMGTTLSGIVIDGNDIIILNVGDSRVYSCQQDYIAQLTIDDAPSDISIGEKTNQLSQAFGGRVSYADIKPQIYFEKLEPGVFLICSDGLTDMLTNQEIESAFREHFLDKEKLVSNLLSSALEAGGLDNISIILVEIKHLLSRD